MPAKSTKSSSSTKPTRARSARPTPARSARPTHPAASKRGRATRPRTRRRKPGHEEIAERAYFIHLEEGSSDQLANWLRAERELGPA